MLEGLNSTFKRFDFHTTKSGSIVEDNSTSLSKLVHTFFFNKTLNVLEISLYIKRLY